MKEKLLHAGLSLKYVEIWDSYYSGFLPLTSHFLRPFHIRIRVNL